MKISIVTPSFNQARYLPRTLASVLAQSHADLEHIVIDGGSTDGTVDVLRNHETRLAHWVSEKDRGQSHAINKGMARATGDIVGWINSDDVYLPGAFAAVASFFEENPRAEACCGGLVIIDAEGRVRDAIMPLAEPSLRYNLTQALEVHQQALFLRRSTWRRLGGVDESLRFAMDFDLIVRLMQRTRVHRVRRYLGAIRQHGETKTRTIGEVGKAEIALVRNRSRHSQADTSESRAAVLRATRLAQVLGDVGPRYVLFKLLARQGLLKPALIGLPEIIG